jgi:hypothetical protein
LSKVLPTLSQGAVGPKNLFFGLPAQKHFTDNGLQAPDATVPGQIHAFKAAAVIEEGPQYGIHFLVGRKEDINHDIGKKCCDPFSTATGTGLTCETCARAYLRKVQGLKVRDIDPESHVIPNPAFYLPDTGSGEPSQVVPDHGKGLDLLLVVFTHCQDYLLSEIILTGSSLI